MKPLGITAHFRIAIPTRTEDKIWEAVEEAISEGWNPTRFIAEVRSAWAEALRDQAKAADREFEQEKR